jgi:2-oxoglutarate ferredoxin oxidoreductase subunit delta
VSKPVGTVDIAEELCKGCDLCVPVCPESVLAMTTRPNRKGWPVVELVGPGCTGCTLCADVCPDGVFTVYRDVDAAAGARA